MAQSKRSRVARLLLKAVGELPEDERQLVLEHLIELGLTAGVGPSDAGPRSSRPKARTSPEARSRAAGGPIQLGAQPETWMHFAATAGGPGPDHQMVPVRLSESQHRLLKDWCGEHGFPMAVVVRGLVERFLEEQEGRAA